MNPTNTNSAPHVPPVGADSAGGFSSSLPPAQLDHRTDCDELALYQCETAEARRIRLTSIARDSAEWLAEDLRQINRIEKLGHFANLRDGGNLDQPRQNRRMGIIVLGCLILAALSIGFQMAGWF